MKKIIYILLAVAMSGCYKVDIHNTDHPDKGKLTLTTDWTRRTTGVEIPANYTAESAGAKVTLTGTTAQYPNLLEPGTHTINLYNTAKHIVVNGTIATVAGRNGKSGFEELPEHQFFGSITKTIEKDKGYSETVVMQQITRDLHFDLTITEGDPERIASIEASLQEIAPSWDCAKSAAQPVANIARYVAPTFTRTAGKLKASVRLLGVMGAKQELILNLTFTDGRTEQFTSDITAELATFNTDKHLPMTLSGNVHTPVGSTIGGSITDWSVITSDITATEPSAYAIGDYYPEHKNASTAIGVVFWIDTNDPTYDATTKTSIRGKIVSLDETQLTWGTQATTTGASSQQSGGVNMAAVKAIDDDFSDYPAFKWCADKTTGGKAWYLPALGELLNEFYPTFNVDRTAFNAKLTAASGTAFDGGEYYWSSTEANKDNANSLSLISGLGNIGSKSISTNIRAISAF